jgi:hypothetical protein
MKKSPSAKRVFVGAVGGLCAVSLAIHVASCTAAETDTTYGNPNVLDRNSIPGEGGAAPLSCGAEGGTVKKYDGGACPSFAADIFPYFQATGKWRCSDAPCHGGATAPSIDGKSAASCLVSLQAVTVAGRAYLGDGGAMICNLQGSCGTRMPEPPGQDPTNDELCMLQAWLACGAK